VGALLPYPLDYSASAFRYDNRGTLLGLAGPSRIEPVPSSFPSSPEPVRTSPNQYPRGYWLGYWFRRDPWDP
jgi:hypothetical protein